MSISESSGTAVVNKFPKELLLNFRSVEVVVAASVVVVSFSVVESAVVASVGPNEENPEVSAVAVSAVVVAVVLVIMPGLLLNEEGDLA